MEWEEAVATLPVAAVAEEGEGENGDGQAPMEEGASALRSAWEVALARRSTVVQVHQVVSFTSAAGPVWVVQAEASGPVVFWTTDWVLAWQLEQASRGGARRPAVLLVADRRTGRVTAARLG